MLSIMGFVNPCVVTVASSLPQAVTNRVVFETSTLENKRKIQFTLCIDTGIKLQLLATYFMMTRLDCS